VKRPLNRLVVLCLLPREMDLLDLTRGFDLAVTGWIFVGGDGTTREGTN